MHRKTRWLVAFGVTAVVFAVSLWVSGALLLPLWVKSDSDRWVIASSLGVALAALAGLWGAGFAQNQNEKASEIGEADEHDRSSYPARIQIRAEAKGNSRIYQAGGDQTVNDR
jgi:hypothetical protein